MGMGEVICFLGAIISFLASGANFSTPRKWSKPKLIFLATPLYWLHNGLQTRSTGASIIKHISEGKPPFVWVEQWIVTGNDSENLSDLEKYARLFHIINTLAFAMFGTTMLIITILEGM